MRYSCFGIVQKGKSSLRFSAFGKSTNKSKYRKQFVMPTDILYTQKK